MPTSILQTLPLHSQFAPVSCKNHASGQKSVSQQQTWEVFFSATHPQYNQNADHFCQRAAIMHKQKMTLLRCYLWGVTNNHVLGASGLECCVELAAHAEPVIRRECLLTVHSVPHDTAGIPAQPFILIETVCC